jgi:signal transduction histidine kinase
MLVRSVKLFIDQTDESFRADPSAHVFSMQVDHATFQTLLDEKFSSLGWDFLLESMDEDLSISDLQMLPGIALADNMKSTPPLLVKKFTWYLLKQMYAQFLFALIMLSLSASALLFSFRSLKKQLALNRLRDDFIANISHELKTPVSTVKVALEALRTFDKKKDSIKSVEYLQIASKEIERLEGLVGKVLHHQVLEDPAAMLQKEPRDLYQMVLSIIATLGNQIREKGASVRVLESEESCNVMVDPVYMEGVILNLLDNSLKYGGTKPQISVRITCDSSGPSLSVQDDGPGVPDEYKTQIFDKFFRIPTGDQHNIKGYGLGLNFASQVMTHHGGRISVRNLSPRGCVFTLHFASE